MRSGLSHQESSLEPWTLRIVVAMTAQILKPNWQDRCLTVILVLSASSRPPTFLVELLAASIQLMAPSARIFICTRHTLLHQISFHLAQTSDSNQGGISHTILIPADSTHDVRKMEIFIGVATEIGLTNAILLENTGGHHCHPFLVTMFHSHCAIHNQYC